MDPMETAAGTSSSSKVILSIIAILVVVGIGYVALRSGKDADDAASTSDEMTEEGGFSGNLFDLVARGGSWKCTWAGAMGDAEMTGTVFIDRGKFKTDAEFASGGMNVTAHTIGDGTYVYSWTSIMPTTGFKFRISEGPDAVPPQGTAAQAEQFSTSYDYDCDPWDADSGTFALPDGVTFTETATQ